MRSFVDKVRGYITPSLLILTVGKTLITGGSIAESIAIGFLCAVFGVELWFYLTRRHLIEKREMQRLRKELIEIKIRLTTLHMEKVKTTPSQSPIGNVAWR